MEAQSAGEEEEPDVDTKLLEQCGILDGQPQQNTFEFNNGIIISSKFDSGNLKNCVQKEDNDNYFECFMSGDGLPYTSVGHYKSWFYFSVKGAQAN
jgi:Cytosolic carboxypeptidase N-terminal domain